MRITEDFALAVDSAVRRLRDDFCLAVSIEVIHEELRVVRTGANVRTHVYAPEARAIQPICIENHIAGVTGERVVFRVRRIPLEHDLILTVPVEIADARVVSRVGVGNAIWRRATIRTLQWNGPVRFAPGLHGRALSLFLAFQHRTH